MSEEEKQRLISIWKRINVLSIALVLMSFIMLVYKIWNNSKNLDSPLLPGYTNIYINSSGINLSVFLLAGLIPAVFLSIRKKYMYSTLCILIFFVVGFLLKDHVSIYEYFY